MKFTYLPHYQNRQFWLLAFLLFSTFAVSAQDVMMQGWYWDYPKDGCNGYTGQNHAQTLVDQVTELGEAGITYLWIPPASRASFGECSNGYDPKDLYDLGEFGQGRTGFGTRTEVDALVTAGTAAGVEIVADVVYNHRDGGAFENNPAVQNWIYNYTANVGDAPYPSDRYRFILPIGGSTGNGAGTYTIRIASHTGVAGFNGKPYIFYAQTNTTGFQGLDPEDENEPNGGSDCSPEMGRNAVLGVDYQGVIETGGSCNTDEYLLTVNASDFDPAGDELTIFVRNTDGDYGDQKIYYIASPAGDVTADLEVHTGTDYTQLPSNRGGMNYLNFKPNDSETTTLSGDEDAMLFFYDYEQDYAGTGNGDGTREVLYDWTRFLWDEVGIRGLRMDAVKHFDRAFIGDLMDHLHDNAIDPGMVVGEFFDSNPNTLKGWIDEVYTFMDTDTKNAIDVRVFDFSLREGIRSACDDFGVDVRTKVYGASIPEITGLAGRNNVTFVNNHDFRETTGGNTLIQNDPILGYAYLLTNNQVGLPTIFYPDYYGYPAGSLDFDYHPDNHTPLKDKIDVLMDINKEYIFGATGVQFLNDPNNNLGGSYNLTEGEKTTLFYQVTGSNAGKEVLVAINFAGEELQFNHNINGTNIGQGETFTELTGNNNFPTININDNYSAPITVPARSYVVYVQGERLPTASKATCDFDNTTTSAYDDDWQNNDNGGTGFGAWNLSGTANSGFFLHSSTTNGTMNDTNTDGDINDSDDQAFGLFANSGTIASATRSFTTPLSAGDVFTIQMDNGFINDDSNNNNLDGSVGVGLQNSSNEPLAEIFFKGGATHYTINDAAGEQSTGIPFTDEGLELCFTIKDNDQYDLRITRLSDNFTKIFNGRTLATSGNSMVVDAFRIFNFNAGNGGAANAYFNNFNICAAADIEVNDATIGTDFGTISTGTVTKTYTISNNGAATLTIDDIRSNNPAFVISNFTNNTQLANGETITFDVTFTPQAHGAETATITINNSTVDENPYTFDVTGAAEVTVSIAVAPTSVDENAASDLVYTISRSSFLTNALEVSFTPSGSATSATDYTALSSTTVTIPAQESSVSITVTPIDDDIVEADETLILALDNSSNYNISPTAGSATGTINNDDLTRFSIDDVSMDEGNSNNNFVFTVSIDKAADQAISVVATTMAGTATGGGNDYNDKTETLTFNAGELTKTFSVQVIGDLISEDNENFTVKLSDPKFGASTDLTKVTIADDTGTGDIINDDVTTITIADLTINEGAGTASFIAMADKAFSGGFSIEVSTTDNSATANEDYTPLTNFSVAFVGNANESQAINVTINNDEVLEPNETFTLSIVTATSTKIIISDTATGTITDNDAATITIADVIVNENAGTATFVATLDAAVQDGFTVDVTTTNVSANGDDYALATASQTLTFNGTKDEVQNITINITDDAVVENDETFTVGLQNVSKSDITITDTATGTITDNDAATITIADVIVNENAGTATFVATLDAAVQDGFTVDVTTTNVSAIGDDYALATASQTLTFNGTKDEVQNITINITDDAVVENDETFTVGLQNVSKSDITISDTATGTITDNDAATITIADVIVNENAGTATFVATLDAAVQDGFTVDVTTTNVSANGDDYALAATSQTLTFNGTKDEVQNITINITDDAVVENDETFTVGLQNVSKSDITITDTATGTITDNDAATITIADVIVNENAGTATFVATLDAAVQDGFTVDINTEDITNQAVAGSDYTSNNVELTFNGTANESQNFIVTITNDLVVETDEDFKVLLSNISNTKVDITDDATGTITNDDATAITINDIMLAEGNTGTTAFKFTISLSNPTAKAIGFTASTSNGTATGGGVDFNDLNNTFNIPANMTTGEVTVNVIGETTVESDETFSLNLSNPTFDGTTDATRVSISDDEGMATIQNDDMVTFSIADESIAEGNAGTSELTFTITASSPVLNTTTIQYATTDDTAEDENNDNDYVSETNTVTFMPNESSKTFTITINGDMETEPNESFFVNLSDGGMGNPQFSDNQAIGTITNDDSPSFSIDDQSIIETNNGTTTMTFKVTLNRPGSNMTTIDYVTMDGSATVADNDYNATSGTLNFPNGTNTQDITITVTGDEKVELDQDFKVILSNPTGDDMPTIADDTGVGTISNDDIATLTIADNSAPEGQNITFAVTLDKVLDNGLTVDYVTNNNTAIGGTDYTSSNDKLTFAGTSINEMQTITINTSDDNLAEADELFAVVLSNIQASGLAVNFANNDDTATGTITNNDIPKISIDDITKAENLTDFVFTISMDIEADHEISVNATSAHDSATGGAVDFSDLTNTSVVFAAGDTEKTITVTVNDDNIVENSEQFFINLSAATGISNPTITDSQGVGTITDNDAAKISVSDQTAAENVGMMTFTVALDKIVDNDVTVQVATATNTANSTDFTALSQSVTIDAGMASTTIMVAITDDNTVEYSEAFNVNLSNIMAGGRNVTLGDSGRGVIEDNDAATISIADASIEEGDMGTKNLSFTVTMSAATSGTISMEYNTINNTATTTDNDYEAANNTITFNAGSALTQMVEVVINGDETVEADETFNLALSALMTNGLDVTFADNSAVGTIENDDDNPVLPLEWLAFNAKLTKDYTVLLTWSTANEINNKHFVVERATDGINFTAISTIESQNNDNEWFNYQFTDKQPLYGDNYYRIRQLDNNGHHSFSIVRLVKMNKFTIHAYPNPTIDVLNISYPDNDKEEVLLAILNAQGQLLYRNMISLVNGQSSLSLSALNVHTGGTYRVLLQLPDGTTEMLTFVKLME